MDQRSLIEIHSELDADGWETQVEITDNSQKGKVVCYLLSHPRLQNESLKVILEYPIASESGNYELTVKEVHQIVSINIYKTETEAQFALLDTCKKQTAFALDGLPEHGPSPQSR